MRRAQEAQDPDLAAALANYGKTPTPAQPSMVLESMRRTAGAQDPILASGLADYSLPWETIATYPTTVAGKPVLDAKGGLPTNAGAVYAGPLVPNTKSVGSMPTYTDLLNNFGVTPKPANPYGQLLENAEQLAQPFPAPSRDRPVDPRIVQTMLGEAANQGPMGLAGVAQVIQNRAEQSGMDPVDVVLAPSQFSTWNALNNGGNNPTRYKPGTPEFEAAEDLYRDVRDNAFDFTYGATHYYNPDIVSPTWADPDVVGTERKFDAIDVGDHRYLTRVAPQDRANMNYNPALSASIAAGGIGPDPRRDAPVPATRSAAAAPAAGGIAVGRASVGPGISYAAQEGLGGGRSRDIAGWSPDGSHMVYSDGTRVPDAALPPVQTGGLDRLIANAPGVGNGVGEVITEPVLTLAGLGGGPRPRPVSVSEATMGGGIGPIPGGPMLADPAPAPARTASKTAPTPAPRPDTREMSVWDQAAKAAGGVFENTLIGSAIKNIFPEFWDESGKNIMAMDDGGTSFKGSSDLNSIFSQGGDDMASFISKGSASSGDGGGSKGNSSSFTGGLASGGGGRSKGNSGGVSMNPRGKGGKGNAAPLPIVPGAVGADGLTRDENGLVSKVWWPEVMWPAAGYNPGVMPEHDYFKGFADGGGVGIAAAGEGATMAGTPATAGMDPRLIIIADAEDALEGQHPNPEEAIQAFIEAFGEAAFSQLRERVEQGNSLRASESRLVRGPGGPKDDKVPARINQVEEAALSDGEFVMPTDAVMGAGDGDVVEGAKRLTQLADVLGQRQPSGMRVDKVG